MNASKTNRWGLTVAPGYRVQYHHPRGQKESGTVERINNMDGYGLRVIFVGGSSCGLDDVCSIIYTPRELDVMARHYIIAALWADSPEGTNPRASNAAREKARETCRTFLDIIGPEMMGELREAESQGYGSHPDCGDEAPLFAAMGHDVWLTSSGHGAGFWDRRELEANGLGDRLYAFCGHGKAIPEPYPSFYRGWLYL